MTTLNSIAQRELRRGVADHVIVDTVRLADKLQIDLLPANKTADDVVEAAKKQLSRDISRARRAAFRMLVEGRERNRDNNPERSVLFDEIVAAVLEEYPSWELLYVRGVIADVRTQFDLAMEVKPIERIIDAFDRLPVCAICRVSRADTKRLSFESWNVEPMCGDCASAQVRELQ